MSKADLNKKIKEYTINMDEVVNNFANIHGDDATQVMLVLFHAAQIREILIMCNETNESEVAKIGIGLIKEILASVLDIAQITDDAADAAFTCSENLVSRLTDNFKGFNDDNIH